MTNSAHTNPEMKILPLRVQADLRNAWLKIRLDQVLLPIMRREKLDMWIVDAREYNEDPVIMSLLPEPAMSARRRTILLFWQQPDGSLGRMSLDRYGFGNFYQAGWNPGAESQFECLGRMVREIDPASIGLNYSQTFAFSDGLTHSEYEQILAAIGPEYAGRVSSAERLAVGWLEQRIQPELEAYPGFLEISNAIIAEAFSNRVIQPGVTTTDDVVWWMRQKMNDLGLQAWFQPTVELQAAGELPAPIGKTNPEERKLIQPGDLLHCDMGFYSLGLTTDQQQLAYVLKPGETDAPDGLKAGMAAANRLQDILIGCMLPGRTGNQVLKSALEQARAEGIEPMIYTHPLGYHGHGAGPTIGLWDQQGGVSGAGDYELNNNTSYAIELNVQQAVPEWDGQVVMFALEEDAALVDRHMRWLAGRQEKMHIIE
jgi:Xaa-Pro aminopeptidase